jgi:AraC-like DNA-binding protein
MPVPATRFVADPVGHYVVGRSYVLWCASPNLIGTTAWGVPDAADSRALTDLWSYDRRLRGYDIVMDVSRVRRMDHDGFALVAAYVRTRIEDYAARVRRQLIVLPADPVSGSLVGGLPSFLGYRHTWRAFADLAHGLAWLDHPGAAAAHAEIDALVERATGSVAAGVRACLLADPLRDLAAVGRALGQSERTLQRKLEEAGTSFRDVARDARIQTAAHLLAGSDLKLEAIARQVGYRSMSHFAETFRGRMGVSPADYRRALRR